MTGYFAGCPSCRGYLAHAVALLQALQYQLLRAPERGCLRVRSILAIALCVCLNAARKSNVHHILFGSAKCGASGSRTMGHAENFFAQTSAIASQIDHAKVDKL